MPDIENARDLYEPLPDVDPGDTSGEDAAQAAEEAHGEVDELAGDADPDAAGHGPTEN